MKTLLTSGWVAALAFILGSLWLGHQLDGYNAISQTVSEIGKQGSAFYTHWQAVSIGVGLLLLLFAIGVMVYAKHKTLVILPGAFVLVYGLSQLGTGAFPSPHALHNVFGLSMTLGYFAPLVFGLSWKRKLGKPFMIISLLAFAMVVLGIFLNLSPLFAPELYPLEYYGLVQRFLLYSFYLYFVYVSFTLIRTS